MSLLLFLAALVGIVLLAMLVNLLTGTKASYLHALVLEPGETEAWRDAAADFAIRPRLGQALSMSYPRLRRHTVSWTDRRVIVAQKVLFSSKRMITHQIFFERGKSAASAEVRAAADKFSGGFYGRGFITLIATGYSFAQVNARDCLRIQPTEDSGSVLNVQEAYLFSDRLAELRQSLEPRAEA